MKTDAELVVIHSAGNAVSAVAALRAVYDAGVADGTPVVEPVAEPVKRKRMPEQTIQRAVRAAKVTARQKKKHG